ncbi:MAG: hypothetical protein HY721_09500 [Planctomycetes bacterium]|nr:hypothetical protein [Planctomycetota bacterium]
MPLRWERGTNPYVFNYFGKLRLGPNATPQQIVAQAESLRLKLGFEKVELAGRELDEHAIQEASARLRDPGPLAQELLLVHPQGKKEGGKLKALAEKLRGLAVVPDERFPIGLIHPLGIFWLLPAPGVEAAELPAWSDLGLVGPGDEKDRQLDMVFDA